MGNNNPPSSQGAAGGPGGEAPLPPGAISTHPLDVPPIPLHPSAQKKSAKLPTPAGAKKDPEPKDTLRELVETIVFVVVLVLMLKTFLAEAFVIPTGSMADTLLGYHYKVICRECAYPNLVNASSEADPQNGDLGQVVISNRCENCGAVNKRDTAPQGGFR